MQTTENRRTFAYTMRDMSESDIPAVIGYWNELEALEPTDDGVSEGEFRDWYHNPMNRDKYSIVTLTNDDGSEGRFISVASIGYNPEDGKAWCWFNVHPDYRNGGVGTAVYNELERRANEAGAILMHVTPHQSSTLLTRFLEKRGYELDRYFWAMRLPADRQVDPPAMPEGFTVRTFVPGQDEPLWLQARNETFAEHYGSVERTIEEITHLASEPHFRPEGLFFAFEGDDLAGFCFTGIDPREAERLGFTIGHVHSLGTMPTHRRRGVGRGLLLIAIDYLRNHVEVVELGVEGKNENALPLYEGVGFYRHNGWANMMKKLRDA